MSLEDATYIPQLNAAWPDGDTDDTSQGDDQLRMLKRVLQTVFNSLGNAALTATAAQINTAAISAGQYSSGTSASSLTVAAGVQNFTTQAGLGFAVGQRLRLAHRANLANTMEGLCAAYDKVTGAASITADAISGSGTYADWSVFVVLDVIKPEQKQRAITGNDTLLVGATNSDLQKVLHWAGTANGTLALPAAAAAGNGFFCTLRNGINTDWTIDPSGAELISGQATLAVKPGFSGVLRCNGVGWDLQWTKQRTYSLERLAQVTSNASRTVGPDTYVERGYVVGAGSVAVASTRNGASGGMAWGDYPVNPGDTVATTFAAGVATIAVNGVVMLTGSPASGTTAGTASKHASVTNGGTSNGATTSSFASAVSGASSGSPLGPGVVANTNQLGGTGWGGTGLSGSGGGTAGAAAAGRGGRAVSALSPSVEPLLSLLNGAPGVQSASSGGDGGPGAGGATGATTGAGGHGGIGAGGGATGNGGVAGNGGFGASAGFCGGTGTNGTSGCGAGGGLDATGVIVAPGVAGVLYFKEQAA